MSLTKEEEGAVLEQFAWAVRGVALAEREEDREFLRGLAHGAQDVATSDRRRLTAWEANELARRPETATAEYGAGYREAQRRSLALLNSMRGVKARGARGFNALGALPLEGGR